jgi:RNA polymerase sigma-70 factor (ECF subfamily)
MHDAADFQPADLEHQRAFLQRLARQLVRGEGAAEDLVQDTFVRALERPPASAAALRAWLARVARRLALNRTRGEGRSHERERRVARAETVAPHDEALASLEIQERLIAAVKALDEPYRTTVWLRFHEGLAPGAIAEHLGTGKKTIESRITRGLAPCARSWISARAGSESAGGTACSPGARERWVGAFHGDRSRSQQEARGHGPSSRRDRRRVAARPARAAAGVRGARRSRRIRAGTDPGADRALPDQRTALAPEAAPVLAGDSRTRLVVHVRWPDGAPASDVGLILHPESDPRGERAVQRVSADASGLAQVDTLAPGPVRIEADRGGEMRATLVMGEKTEVVFDLQPGIDVEGTVTDGSGNPVAGAEVLLVSEAIDWLAMRTVTRTRADGSYRVRAVQPEFSITARAESYAPALLQPLNGRSEHARIDFVLGSPGSASGRVLDPADKPVAGALVAAGDPRGYYVHESGAY